MSKDTHALYLDLIKNCLINTIYGEFEFFPVTSNKRLMLRKANELLGHFGYQIVSRIPRDNKNRLEGRSPLPPFAHTVIGINKLNNLQRCIEDTIADGISGDMIEAGVWRGGAVIFMRAVLKAKYITDRYVWAADSFAGLPAPDPSRYPHDRGSKFHKITSLRVTMEEVQDNFRKYDLLDEQVQFLPGWFNETLPRAPIEKLAVLRIDADMYQSTIEALESLYPKLSTGGYTIIDDYGNVNACKQAVDDYRREYNINEPIVWTDHSEIFWRRIK